MFATKTAKSKSNSASSVRAIKQARARRLKAKQEAARKDTAAKQVQRWVRGCAVRRHALSALVDDFQRKVQDLTKLYTLLRRARPDFCLDLDKLMGLIQIKVFVVDTASRKSAIPRDALDAFYALVLPNLRREDLGVNSVASGVLLDATAGGYSDAKHILFRLQRLAEQSVRALRSAGTHWNADSVDFKIIQAMLAFDAQSTSSELRRRLQSYVVRSQELRSIAVRRLHAFHAAIDSHFNKRTVSAGDSDETDDESGVNSSEDGAALSSHVDALLINIRRDTRKSLTDMQPILSVCLEVMLADLRTRTAADLGNDLWLLGRQRLVSDLRPIMEPCLAYSNDSTHASLGDLLYSVRQLVQPVSTNTGVPDTEDDKANVAPVFDFLQAPPPQLFERSKSIPVVHIHQASNFVELLLWATLCRSRSATASDARNASSNVAMLRRLYLLRGCCARRSERWTQCASDMQQVIRLSRALQQIFDSPHASAPEGEHEAYDRVTTGLIFLTRAEATLRGSGVIGTNPAALAAQIRGGSEEYVDDLAARVEGARDDLRSCQDHMKRRHAQEEWFRAKGFIELAENTLKSARNRQRALRKAALRAQKANAATQQHSNGEPSSRNAASEWVNSVRQDIAALSVITREGTTQVAKAPSRRQKKFAAKKQRRAAQRRAKKQRQRRRRVEEKKLQEARQRDLLQSALESQKHEVTAVKPTTKTVEAEDTTETSDAPDTEQNNTSIVATSGESGASTTATNDDVSSNAVVQVDDKAAVANTVPNVAFEAWLAKFRITVKDAAHRELLFRNWSVLQNRVAAVPAQGRTQPPKKVEHGHREEEESVSESSESSSESMDSDDDGSSQSEECESSSGVGSEEVSSQADGSGVTSAELKPKDTPCPTLSQRQQGSKNVKSASATRESTSPATSGRHKVDYVVDGANVGFFYGRQLKSNPKAQRHFSSRGLELALQSLNADVEPGSPPKVSCCLSSSMAASLFWLVICTSFALATRPLRSSRRNSSKVGMSTTWQTTCRFSANL